MNRLFVFLFLSLFLIGFASAATIDNVKSFDKDVGEYGKVKIKNWFGLKDLAELELKENSDSCGTECYALKEIKLHEAGTLVEDVIFETIRKDGSRIEQPIISYEFLIKTEGEKYLVDDYETQCVGNGVINPINLTEEQSCSEVKVGTHEEIRDSWEHYNVGDVLPKGTYTLKLVGSKSPFLNVDWIIKSQGIWVREWAEWGIGGTITHDGNYTVHTFWVNGTFESTGTLNAAILIVGGGGAGGTGASIGGGGGAGGLIYNETYPLTPQVYNVVVGSGGLNNSGNGLDGTNSSFDNLQAMGGGAGGVFNGGSGKDGGSGGGGGQDNFDTSPGGIGVVGQGNNGGTGRTNAGGGGGGADAVGYNSPSDGNGGAGGAGKNYSINGTNLYYAGGGGGGCGGLGGGCISPVGGSAIGGDGSNPSAPATTAAIHTGSGGGGAHTTTRPASSGSDGIVIIRLLTKTDVVLNTPTPFQAFTTNDIVFNASMDVDNELVNATLWIDGIPNETNILSGLINESIWNKNLADGSHNWTVESCDVLSCIFANNESFSIDAAPPQITINSPGILVDYGKINSSITLNWSVTDINLNSMWYNYNGTDQIVYGSENTTQLTIFANDDSTSDCTQEFVNVSTACGGLATGSYVFDGLGWYNPERAIDGDDTTFADFILAFATGHIYINYTKPLLVSNAVWEVVDALGTENLTIPTSCFNYNESKVSLRTLRTDASTISWACYDGAWNVLRTNVFSGGGGEAIGEERMHWDYQGGHDLTFYANDTAGNINSTFVDWDYKVFENSFNFTNVTSSGSIEAYILNVTLAAGQDITSATLINGAVNISSSIFSSGNERSLSIPSYIIPSYPISTNVSLSYFIQLADSTQITTTPINQTVNPVSIDDCSVFTNQILNISLLKERDQTALSGDIDVNLLLLNSFDFGLVSNLNLSVTSTQNLGVCSESDLTSSGLKYSAEIKYGATGYVSEFYNIQRADIPTTPTAVNLYDLNQNFSTNFKIVYQDSNFEFVEGAVVQLQRKYISEGIYKVVEAPLTSSDGTASVHVDLDTNLYKATIVRDGVVLDTFDNLVFICDSILTGDCTQELLGKISPEGDIDLTSLIDFAYSDPTVVNDTVTLSFSIPSGTPAGVNLQLTQKDQFGNTTLCDQTITSSAGSIECTFNPTMFESLLEYKIYKDGNLLFETAYVVPQDNNLLFLGNNFIIVFLLLFTLIGMAFTSPEWIVIMGVMTFLISGALWLLSDLSFVVGIGTLVWLFIAAAILIFKMSRQEDR